MARKLDPEKLIVVEFAMASGVSLASIERDYAKQWGVEGRHVRRYIKSVKESWDRRESAPIEEKRARLAEMTLHVYRRALLKGHDGSAIRALDLAAKIYGITKSDVLAAVGIYDPRGAYTSNDAIKARLAELREQQLAMLAPGDEDKDGGSN